MDFAKGLRLAYDILEKKVIADITDEAKENKKDDMVEFLKDYFQQRYGLPAMADERLKAFVHSCFKNAHAKDSENMSRLARFLTLVGLQDGHMYSRHLADLWVTMLRRAYDADHNSIAERLDDGLGQCFVQVTRAVEMVIGLHEDPEGTSTVRRADRSTWQYPQFEHVATPGTKPSALDQFKTSTKRV